MRPRFLRVSTTGLAPLPRHTLLVPSGGPAHTAPGRTIDPVRHLLAACTALGVLLASTPARAEGWSRIRGGSGSFHLLRLQPAGDSELDAAAVGAEVRVHLTWRSPRPTAEWYGLRAEVGVAAAGGVLHDVPFEFEDAFFTYVPVGLAFQVGIGGRAGGCWRGLVVGVGYQLGLVSITDESTSVTLLPATLRISWDVGRLDRGGLHAAADFSPGWGGPWVLALSVGWARF